MKVLNYQFKNMCEDVFFILEEEIVNKFTQTAIDFRVHTYDKFNFFFIGSDEDHVDMLSIINNTEDLKEIFGSFSVETNDVTENILMNVEKFENLDNFCSKENVLLNFYESNISADFILDKISEHGIESLTEKDKSFLQRA